MCFMQIVQKKCPIGLVPHDYKGDILSHPGIVYNVVNVLLLVLRKQLDIIKLL